MSAGRISCRWLKQLVCWWVGGLCCKKCPFYAKQAVFQNTDGPTNRPTQQVLESRARSWFPWCCRLWSATRQPSWATRFNPFNWFPAWRPTSMNQLFQAESRMLRLVKANLDKFFVNICNDKYRQVRVCSVEFLGLPYVRGSPFISQCLALR